MIEYPSIVSSSKAPRGHGIAFNKLDGSNFRAKWTAKQGFHVFGTKTQLIDENTEFWGEMVRVFKRDLEKPLVEKFTKDKNYRHEREIVAYGEFFGPNSFAGRHVESDPKKIVLFDVMIGHKNRRFLNPTDFVREFQEVVEIPDIVYVGNLNDEFIADVRANKFGLQEGVLFKGTKTNGAYRGNVWMCKIKTQEYFEKLKAFFGVDWERYWE